MEEYCSGLCSLMVESGADANLALFLSLLVGVLLVSGVPLITVILLIWIERKVAARIQDRIGPNRVGPIGLLQTIADMIKLLSKEDITPTAADRVLYNAAPLGVFRIGGSHLGGHSLYALSLRRRSRDWRAVFCGDRVFRHAGDHGGGLGEQ